MQEKQIDEKDKIRKKNYVRDDDVKTYYRWKHERNLMI